MKMYSLVVVDFLWIHFEFAILVIRVGLVPSPEKGISSEIRQNHPTAVPEIYVFYIQFIVNSRYVRRLTRSTQDETQTDVRRLQNGGKRTGRHTPDTKISPYSWEIMLLYLLASALSIDAFTSAKFLIAWFKAGKRAVYFLRWGLAIGDIGMWFTQGHRYASDAGRLRVL